jgi:hypothetical protein
MGEAMNRNSEKIDAAACRSIRIGDAPLVPSTLESPRAIIRQAHMRLRELRLEARGRAQIDREGAQ